MTFIYSYSIYTIFLLCKFLPHTNRLLKITCLILHKNLMPNNNVSRSNIGTAISVSDNAMNGR